MRFLPIVLLLVARLAFGAAPDIASDDKWLTYDAPNTGLANASTWYTGLSTTTKENTKAIIARIYWSAIEGTDGTGTTSGTFYHTAITNFLDTVETSHASLTNDPCVLIFVMARKFNNTSVAIPYDWTTGVATTTNVIPKDLVDADYEFLDGTTHTGAMWATTVRTRYQKALQGIYTAFGAHAAFCGVTSSETAGMMSYTGNPVAYSLSAYTDELEALNEAMSDTAESADLWWNPMINFISGANTDALRKSAWDEIYDTVATTHTIIGFPDLLRSGASNFSGVNNQVYEMVEESYGDQVTTRLQDFKQVGHFQNDSYGDNGTGGEGPGGLFTMEQMRRWSEDTFSHVTVLAYTHQNFEAQTYDTARTGYDLGDGLAAQIRPWGAPILGGDTYLFTQLETTSTSDKNVDFDARCFNPYTKTAMLDQVREDDEAFVLSLNQYATAGPDVTSDACGVINPVVSLDATTDANGCDIGGDGDNPTLTCTLTSTTLNAHTTTVTFDNDLGSAVTRQFDWTVTAAAASEATYGVVETDEGEPCDRWVAGDGNDNLNCTSYANRCRTLAKVQGLTLTDGENICLVNDGTVYNLQRFIGQHDGTSTDWVGLRCANPDGTSCTVSNLRNADGTLNSSTSDFSTMPIIRGSFIDSCREAGTCTIGTGAMPPSKNAGLIDLTNRTKWYIEGIRLENSAGEGIGVEDSTDIIIRYNYITEVYASCFKRNDTDRAAAYGNYCIDAFGGHAYDYQAGYGSGIHAARSTNILTYENTVLKVGGECINHFASGATNSNIYVYKNVALNCQSDAISMDSCTDCMAERNITSADPSNEVPSFGGGNGRIGNRSEFEGCASPSHASHRRSIVRYNMLAGGGEPFNAGGNLTIHFGRNWDECGDVQATKYAYGNSLIGTASGLSNSTGESPNGYARNVLWQNNAVYPLTASSTNGCGFDPSSILDATHNLYRVAPSDANCNSVDDVVGSPTDLGAALSAFPDFDLNSWPTESDFTPAVTSNLYHVGKGAITQVNDVGGGTGTTFVVDNAELFKDGYDCTGCVNDKLWAGDTIQVGADTGLVITDINPTTNAITVDSSFTWADGEDVCLKTCTVNIGFDPDVF